MYYLLLLLACVAFSCSSPKLSVQTDYLRRENLASFYINSPDPLLNYPLIGQRLIVQWDLPEEMMHGDALSIVVQVRFTNRSQQSLIVPIHQKTGTYIYTVENQAYMDTGGFQTYRADLVSNGKVIDSWQHQLWVELIQLDTPASNPE